MKRSQGHLDVLKIKNNKTYKLDSLGSWARIQQKVLAAAEADA